ncbi:MAG TPA: energy transducer TonB [Longimicrobium sp.]|nr:energy transducer TonB [Longimicrobium sp.]
MSLKHISLAVALCCAAAPATAQDAPAADSTRVYELAEVETPPRPSNVDSLRAALQASYPPALLQAGAGGRVHVAFVVAADGSVGQAQVISSTDPAFDAPTLASVAVLRFTPGMRGGSAVATRVEIPIDWKAPPPAQETRVYEMADVEVEPRPLNLREVRHTIERAYPPELRARRVSGFVHVRLRVDREGVPRDLNVTRTSHVAFNQPTLESLALLRFSPALVGGGPVEVWIDLPIQWHMTRGVFSTEPNR